MEKLLGGYSGRREQACRGHPRNDLPAEASSLHDKESEEAMSLRKQQGSDVCVCGDYRSQHDINGGCQACLGIAFDHCEGFKLGHKASEKEQAHWDKYHERSKS